MTHDEIISLYRQRQKDQAEIHQRMEEIRALYNGDIKVPLPELSRDEKAVAANLAQLGIDQMAMRITSVTPAVRFAVDRIASDAAKSRARDKQDVILRHWWPRSRVLTHILPRRARWLLAFSVAPVMLRPDEDGLPCWYERHPISTYPAAVTSTSEIVPPNVIFRYLLPAETLRRSYPAQYARITGGDRPAPLYEVVEYVDDERITCIVLNNEYAEPLLDIPNRAGRPLAVIPGRITLDKPLGQYDGLIGAYQLQARLMALYVIAQERAVFPEMWLISPPGAPEAEIITPADPREGIIGEIRGGTLQKIDTSASPVTSNLIDRLEYVERATAAVPAEFSGFSTTNVRTGRRGDAIMAAAVDFRLQEAQTIFEESLEEENRIAIAIAKAYSTKKFSFTTPTRGKVTYSADLFDGNDDHEVRYAYAGADAQSLTIAIGQKLGMETISRDTAMRLDPMVEDVEAERDLIVSEAVQRAFLTCIQTLAADPNATWQPIDFARFGELVESDRMNVYEAAQTVHREVQERQAAQQQGLVQGPDAMPGLSQPGTPGAPTPSQPSVANLTSLLAALRGA